VSAESLKIAKSRYITGKAAFENGLYQQAVDNLEKARALLSSSTRFAGEVDMWLVTAYEASGRSTEAIALCEKLTQHPHYETRQQARQLVYILKAPKLKRPKEWMTEIPDLAGLAENEPKILVPARSKTSSQQKQLESVDLSQVNTQDNRFIWTTLIAICLIATYMIWLGLK
jgi:tetratricopeptide (TPR) repeat protein